MAATSARRLEAVPENLPKVAEEYFEADRAAALTRRWRLLGYAKASRAADRVVLHESTCTGDQALDEAMTRLEVDQRIGRIRVEPL